MKNASTLFFCSLTILSVLLSGCSERDVPLAPIVEDNPEMQIDLGLTKTIDYVPTDVTTIPMVTGGSGEYGYELYRDGELIGNEPIEVLHFADEEIGRYQIKLKVTDLETDQVLQKEVIFTGKHLPNGAPLENWLLSPNPIVYIGEDVFMNGGARGGSGHYQYDMLLNGESVGQMAIMPVTINELGSNELVLRTTDLETGEVVETMPFMVVGLNKLITELQGAMVLAPKHVPVGDPVFITMTGMSGRPPYTGRIEIDGQLVSNSFMSVFTPQEAKGYHVRCYLNDSNGELLIMDEMVDAFVPDSYVSPMTIDTTATPWNGPVPFYTTLHADIRGGTPPYSDIIWYDDQGNSIGATTNLYRLIDDQGERTYEVRVIDSLGQTISDIVTVVGEAPNAPPVVVDASAAPPVGTVGTVSVLDANVQGGEGMIDYVWRTNDGAIVGTGESIYYTFNHVGFDTVTVFVTDEVYQHDQTSVILKGQPTSTTIRWSVGTDLVAGPSDRHDSDTVYINQGQYYSRIWFQVRMDVRDEDRETMTLEAVYADGSRRYWQIPDVLDDRPAEFVVDGGECWIEEAVHFSWYYPGGTSDLKCDSWNRVLEISGSYELPAQYQGLPTLRVVGSSQRPIALSH